MSSRMYDALRRALTESGETQPEERFPAEVRSHSSTSLPQREEYQRILNAITGPVGKGPCRVVLVISSIHGEGTSTVARNLAQALADRGETLLVEANLRQPSQQQALGLVASGGLGDVAEGRMSLQRAIVRTRVPGLSLLAGGRSSESSSALPDAPAIGGALSEARGTFNWIVIDGPPVTVCSEAVNLAGLVDGIILVVLAESTRWEVAERAKRILEDSGGHLVGAVLNRRRYHIPEAIYRRL